MGSCSKRTQAAQTFLADQRVQPGEAVVIDADYSPGSIALLMATIANRNIVVPIAAHVKSDREKYAEISEAKWYFKVLPDDRYRRPHSYSREMKHPFNLQLKNQGSPGLILFSSGSTGEPKASLHNLDFLLAKYQVQRNSQRILAFLLFDHIGGFNTLFYTLSNHGCVIALDARDAVSVCGAIERHRAQVLPTSPTFLNLLLMSEAWRDYNLSSLQLITYGTEAMPQATLRKLNEIFPHIRFLQTYGLSELGILRSKSRSSDSLWVKVGGEDYETRIVLECCTFAPRARWLVTLTLRPPLTRMAGSIPRMRWMSKASGCASRAARATSSTSAVRKSIRPKSSPLSSNG